MVRASLPGVDSDEIKVTIEDGVLTIDGETKVDDEAKVGNYLIRECRAGSFQRSDRRHSQGGVRTRQASHRALREGLKERRKVILRSSLSGVGGRP